MCAWHTPFSIKNYIEKDLNLVNSFDTWHGTKNVARLMKPIAIGAVKRSGVTWFPELSDKRKSTKTHVYYCMKNCDKSPEKLRSSILNIVDHYQGYHSNCFNESQCKKSGYFSEKIRITSPNAITAYTKKLKETLIYADAESYCRCRDTFWVESFNHHLLSYLPKRIHFKTETFVMRMNLACLDWNENVDYDRPYTSERFGQQDLRRPGRRAPFRVLVKKSFLFVDDIWKEYIKTNCVDLRPCVSDLMEIDEDSAVTMTEDDDDDIDDGVEVDRDVFDDDVDEY